MMSELGILRIKVNQEIRFMKVGGEGGNKLKIISYLLNQKIKCLDI